MKVGERRALRGVAASPAVGERSALAGRALAAGARDGADSLNFLGIPEAELTPKVQEALVIGVPDEARGELVKACLVLRPGQTATEDEILSFCRENMARYKVPSKIEFRAELPRSAVGKLLRRVLREEESTRAA